MCLRWSEKNSGEINGFYSSLGLAEWIKCWYSRAKMYFPGYGSWKGRKSIHDPEGALQPSAQSSAQLWREQVLGISKRCQPWVTAASAPLVGYWNGEASVRLY